MKTKQQSDGFVFFLLASHWRLTSCILSDDWVRWEFAFLA